MLELSCDPRAAAAAAAAAPLAPQCAAANSLPACHAAAGSESPLTLTSADLWAARDRETPVATPDAESGFGVFEFGGSLGVFSAHPRLPVAAAKEEVKVCDSVDARHRAAAAEAGVRCAWQKFMPGDTGECRAVAAAQPGGPAAGDLQAVDTTAASCNANNRVTDDSGTLAGCIDGTLRADAPHPLTRRFLSLLARVSWCLGFECLVPCRMLRPSCDSVITSCLAIDHMYSASLLAGRCRT